MANTLHDSRKHEMGNEYTEMLREIDSSGYVPTHPRAKQFLKDMMRHVTDHGYLISIKQQQWIERMWREARND